MRKGRRQSRLERGNRNQNLESVLPSGGPSLPHLTLPPVEKKKAYGIGLFLERTQMEC